MSSAQIMTVLILILTNDSASQLIANSLKSNGIFDLGRVVGEPFTSINLSEDGRLNFTEIAWKYGQRCDEHAVVTEDGYILTLFHIPGDVSKAVLLAHGGLESADAWIIRGESSLAITLARRGYDVWSLDFRGATYSRSHITLDPGKDAQFFNFTFYEQGYYDLPATIDYILEKTGQDRIAAIGHSLGTTAFYVLGAEKPEFNEKIKIFISLAPIAFLKNQRGVIPRILDGISLLNSAGLISINEDRGIEAFGRRFKYIIQAFCLNPLNINLCSQFLYALTGYDPAGLEPGFLRTLLGHLGALSSKHFLHFVQIKQRDQFARYDYGGPRNMEVYHSEQPPLIDLGKVAMRIALLVGKEDLLATIPDTIRLNESLGNVVHYEILPYEKFSHLDFVFGRYMPENLYPFVFSLLEDV